MDILLNALFDTLYTALYFGIVGIIALLVKYVFKVHGEWYRKILHLCFMGSIFCFLYFFDYWYTSAIVLIIFLIIALVGLTILERFPFYAELLAERSKGEVKRSITIAFIVYLVSISVVWGIWGDTHKYIVLAAVLAWGIGDALAALVGQNKNNLVINTNIIKSRKTVQGTIAMFVGSTIAIFLVVARYKPLTYSILISLFAGLVATIAEVYTKEGWDTASVPPIVLISLLLGTFM